LGVEWVPSSGGADIWPKIPCGALFDCLGIYHDILSGRSCDEIWKGIQAALQDKPTEVKLLLELVGCEFCQDFQILDGSIYRMSEKRWLALCSRGEALSASQGYSIWLPGEGRW